MEQSPATLKSSRRRNQRQDDHNSNTHNGYNKLPEPYFTYYKVAMPIASSVPDREDLLNTIITNLADAGRSNGHKLDNRSWMYKIASFTKSPILERTLQAD